MRGAHWMVKQALISVNFSEFKKIANDTVVHADKEIMYIEYQF